MQLKHMTGHTLIFFAKASIGDNKISHPPTRIKIFSVFASRQTSTGAVNGSFH
jgi:hypothetical protein